MKKVLTTFFAIFACALCASGSEKEIYLPKELRGIDFNDSTSQWSYSRMELTPNFAIFWERGFGNDLKNPPMLDGNDMSVDMENLKEKLERFYSFFKDTLDFIRPGSNADKYRMMVMLHYSLEGTAYGGDYDKVIGAFWVAPNRLRDSTLNCVAHELGHSFQLQVACDRLTELVRANADTTDYREWNVGPFYEMTSQWMLWHVNPNWIHDEKYHWDAFRHAPHKAFLHWENAYHSPYVLEYWSEKHGLPVIAKLFRESLKEEDPVEAYRRLTGIGQEEFNDEMFDACRRMVNLDFRHAYDITRQYVDEFTTVMVDTDGWLVPSADCCPEDYGFNVIKINNIGNISIRFEELSDVSGFNIQHPEESGWRYGLVGIMADGTSVYGPEGRDGKGRLSFRQQKGMDLKALYLVVMAAPNKHRRNPENPEREKSRQWPYRIKVEG